MGQLHLCVFCTLRFFIFNVVEEIRTSVYVIYYLTELLLSTSHGYLQFKCMVIQSATSMKRVCVFVVLHVCLRYAGKLCGDWCVVTGAVELPVSPSCIKRRDDTAVARKHYITILARTFSHLIVNNNCCKKTTMCMNCIFKVSSNYIVIFFLSRK